MHTTRTRPLASLRACVTWLSLGLPAAAQAVSLSCYENPRTNAQTCYSAPEVREANGIRTAPIYMGGPKSVRKSNITIAINCATKVAHLKDRDGVSFAGGTAADGTRTLRALQEWICAEPLKPQKARK